MCVSKPSNCNEKQTVVRSSDMKQSPETEIDDLASLAVVDDTEDESISSVYEIGYHLVPTLSEEGVTAAVKDITELLKKNGAETVGDHFPAKIPLAYTIQKRVAGKILRFDEAYFGWVAFEMPREAVAVIKEALDAHPAVLRYLIVTTSRDAVAAALSGAVAEVPVIGQIEKPKRAAEVGGEVSDAALNQALESMATEDAKVSE